jgi:hypothetical protein
MEPETRGISIFCNPEKRYLSRRRTCKYLTQCFAKSFLELEPSSEFMDRSSEASDLALTTRERSGLRLFVVAMIRNESDVILPFLRQCAELFDKILVADIQSTDGTSAALRSFADPRLQVHVYHVDRREKYQSALMNCLSREAFAQGADWVFFLDADEFLDVANRAKLERYLEEFGSDVMIGPWINLVPAHYGSYGSFDASQQFFWSGRTSRYTKVALSRLFAANNPHYFVHEGNHFVSPAPNADPISDRPGLPLLHVPIRSIDQFKYKIGVARRLTQAKHNRGQGEGFHVCELDELLSVGSVEPAELNFMAANYGEPFEDKRTLDPTESGWPVRRLPAYVAEAARSPPLWEGQFANLSETLLADALTVWDQTEFVKDSLVAAVIDGERIRIVPQPVMGSGRFRVGRFQALGPAMVTDRPLVEPLIDVVGVSGVRVKTFAFSAWSELIPVMYALFVVLKPRRFVELGVRNGMSFFAACQVAERLGLETECVGIDSWIGDEHAGFHSSKVFGDFRAYLQENYPRQQYIQAYFSAARACYDDGSIDLLLIDGLGTYEAVKDDFETWLPKLTEVGVIIVHDINVFERSFGVWRLWEELRVRYPAYGFAQQHGLGIIYVGLEPHPFAALLRSLAENRQYAALLQIYFEVNGRLLIEHGANLTALEQENASLRGRLAELQSSFDAVIHSSEQENASLRGRLTEVQSSFDAVIHSWSWRATAPVRRLLARHPALSRLVRRAAKLGWWTR